VRPRGAILSASGAGLLAIGCCAAPAQSAPATQLPLTGQEYAPLSASKLGFDQALRDKGRDWLAADQNACLTDTLGRQPRR
jgi:hypothetical protein